MAVNVRRMKASVEEVFDVLADGWMYTSWVVGTSRLRGVEPDWPAVGSRLHHSFGLWPAVIDDSTRVEEWDPPHRAVFVARGGPIGEARVQIDVRPSPSGCLVRMEETPVSGPATLVPGPVADPAIWIRNREALYRLSLIVESPDRRASR